MTDLHYAAVQALAGAAALSLLCFDTRGRRHKPLFAFIAYCLFLYMSALVLAAHLHLDDVMVWLLIFSLALQTGSILLSGGNVGKIHQGIVCPDWKKRQNAARLWWDLRRAAFRLLWLKIKTYGYRKHGR